MVISHRLAHPRLNLKNTFLDILLEFYFTNKKKLMRLILRLFYKSSHLREK